MNIREAERLITKTLMELERENGVIIKSIEVRDLDITKFGDDHPQHLRRVVITASPSPGEHWE